MDLFIIMDCPCLVMAATSGLRGLKYKVVSSPLLRYQSCQCDNGVSLLTHHKHWTCVMSAFEQQYTRTVFMVSTVRHILRYGVLPMKQTELLTLLSDIAVHGADVPQAF